MGEQFEQARLTIGYISYAHGRMKRRPYQLGQQGQCEGRARRDFGQDGERRMADQSARGALNGRLVDVQVKLGSN